MKQIQVFPFSRDGYHYDVQPGFSPVFDSGPGIVTPYRMESPWEFGHITVTGVDMDMCQSRMQDMLHDLFVTLLKADSLSLLNRKGQSILDSYRKTLIITNP